MSACLVACRVSLTSISPARHSNLNVSSCIHCVHSLIFFFVALRPTEHECGNYIGWGGEGESADNKSSIACAHVCCDRWETSTLTWLFHHFWHCSQRQNSFDNSLRRNMSYKSHREDLELNKSLRWDLFGSLNSAKCHLKEDVATQLIADDVLGEMFCSHTSEASASRAWFLPLGFRFLLWFISGLNGFAVNVESCNRFCITAKSMQFNVEIFLDGLSFRNCLCRQISLKVEGLMCLKWFNSFNFNRWKSHVSKMIISLI